MRNLSRGTWGHWHFQSIYFFVISNFFQQIAVNWRFNASISHHSFFQIFGPILPVITVKNPEEAIAFINDRWAFALLPFPRKALSKTADIPERSPWHSTSSAATPAKWTLSRIERRAEVSWSTTPSCTSRVSVIVGVLNSGGSVLKIGERDEIHAVFP